jgi:hypothetical protein
MSWADIVRSNYQLVKDGDFRSLYRLIKREDRKNLYKMFKDLGVNPYGQVKTLKDLSWTSGMETFVIIDPIRFVVNEEYTNEWEFMLGLLCNICNSIEDYSYLTSNIKKQSVIDVVNDRFRNENYPLHYTKFADGSIAVNLQGARVMYDAELQDIYIEGIPYQWPPDYLMNARLRFRWDEQL